MRILFSMFILLWSFVCNAAPGSYSGNIDMDDGGGDLAILGYLLLAGLAPPVFSKLFTIGSWKDDSWVGVGFSGILNALVLIMAIQVALAAIVVIPIYLIIKIFSK